MQSSIDVKKGEFVLKREVDRLTLAWCDSSRGEEGQEGVEGAEGYDEGREGDGGTRQKFQIAVEPLLAARYRSISPIFSVLIMRILEVDSAFQHSRFSHYLANFDESDGSRELSSNCRACRSLSSTRERVTTVPFSCAARFSEINSSIHEPV